MPIVLLVRHGESQANAGLPTAHPKTVRLTKKGREQVENIPHVLRKTNLIPDLIVVSTYIRSQQTAKPTIQSFPSIPVKEWRVHEFTYLSSKHAGRTTVEQRRVWVNAYWEKADPFYVDEEESESFEQFIVRVRKAIAQLKQTAKDTIIVFSHEQFICALLWLLQKDQPEDNIDSTAMQDFKAFHRTHGVPNGAIVQVDMREGSTYGTFELITFHLEMKTFIPTE